MFKKTENYSNLFITLIKNDSENKLEKFRQYAQGIESEFKQEVKQRNKRFDEQTEELDDYEKAELKEFLSDTYVQLEDIYVKIHRRSILVSIYSFLENSLNRLCNQLNSRNKYPIKVEDLKGEGVVRAKIYLEKLVQIDFSIINTEWSCIQELNKLRNCIVHCEGDISNYRQKKAIENIVKNNKNLSLLFDHEIMVDYEYIDSVLTNTEAFLNKLYDQALHK